LDERTFSEISDIDIAVEGSAGVEEYFAALAEAMFMTSFPPDIVGLDKLDRERDGACGLLSGLWWTGVGVASGGARPHRGARFRSFRV